MNQELSNFIGYTMKDKKITVYKNYCTRENAKNVKPGMPLEDQNLDFEKETFDIEKFRILMMKIYDEIELVKNCEILKKTLSETRNSILLFENELQTLVDEIEGGKPLEDSCDLGY